MQIFTQYFFKIYTMNFFLLFATFLVVICKISANNNFLNVDYCQLNCNNGFGEITHVKCEREADNCGPHKRCENFAQVEITKKLRALILSEHNKYRNKVAVGQETRGPNGPQPSASNMRALIYNEELENIAQCWANTCQMQNHSYCNRGTYLKYVGQNMALRSYSWPEGVQDFKKNLKLMIQAWYDEVKLFNKDYVKRFVFNLSYGHYTQMIWATAEEIGCGVTLYTKGGWYNILLVCHYGSRSLSGNVINYEVYKTGKPCSKCPQGTECSSKYKGLCEDVKNRITYQKIIKLNEVISEVNITTTSPPQQITQDLNNDANINNTPEEYKSETPEEYRSVTPEEYKSVIPEEYRSALPEEYRSETPEEYRSTIPEENKSETPEQYGSVTPEEINNYNPNQDTQDINYYAYDTRSTLNS